MARAQRTPTPLAITEVDAAERDLSAERGAATTRHQSSRSGIAISRSTPIEELPQYLTVDEVQAYLAIGRSASYRIARERGARFGRLLRVPREALRP